MHTKIRALPITRIRALMKTPAALCCRGREVGTSSQFFYGPGCELLSASLVSGLALNHLRGVRAMLHARRWCGQL
jgi:hypothetical protein